MFFTRNKAPFLSAQDTEKILNCIREEERSTSGEIRLCIESRCKYTNPVDRARELFLHLKMFNTVDRNAVLIYIAHEDRDFALFGDAAIHQKVHMDFWIQEAHRLSRHFHQQQYTQGILECIQHTGAQLKTYFPWEGEQKNELPDEIIFGK
jgi:uncharacterized membrane protein